MFYFDLQCRNGKLTVGGCYCAPAPTHSSYYSQTLTNHTWLYEMTVSTSSAHHLWSCMWRFPVEGVSHLPLVDAPSSSGQSCMWRFPVEGSSDQC
ncbi:unnamed protein product [Coregonus sp. 'balchen']|nr:unnamed protein product [Coregonus sp. 'balchen']